VVREDEASSALFGCHPDVVRRAALHGVNSVNPPCCSRIRPAKVCRSVVLPEPFGPRTATI
jgi:hypothetical protein